MSALIRRLIFVFALALLGIAGTNGASATGYAVSIIGTPQVSNFTPASLTIAVNDTVTWTNDSPTVHYVVFAGASPVTVQNNTPYTKTFTSPGTFSYYCSKHPSMTGTIVVVGPATPAPTAPPTPAPTAPPTPAPTAPPTPAPTLAPPPPPAPTVAPLPTPAPVIRTAAPAPVWIAPAPAPTLAPTPEPTEEPTPEPVAIADVTPTNTPEPSVEPLAVAPVERSASLVAGDPAEPRLAAPPEAGVSPLVWWSAFTAATALALGLLFWLFFFGPLRVRRYWFEFDVDSSTATSGLRERLARGCGVTGRDEDDCLDLIKRDVVADNELPKVRRVIRDVDLSSLSTMIRQTMDGTRTRGVWYPTSRS